MVRSAAQGKSHRGSGSLEQINEAIAVMERGEALRNVIVFAPDA
jgi:hypothetical protein